MTLTNSILPLRMLQQEPTTLAAVRTTMDPVENKVRKLPPEEEVLYPSNSCRLAT